MSLSILARQLTDNVRANAFEAGFAKAAKDAGLTEAEYKIAREIGVKQLQKQSQTQPVAPMSSMPLSGRRSRHAPQKPKPAAPKWNVEAPADAANSTATAMPQPAAPPAAKPLTVNWTPSAPGARNYTPPTADYSASLDARQATPSPAAKPQQAAPATTANLGKALTNKPLSVMKSPVTKAAADASVMKQIEEASRESHYADLAAKLTASGKEFDKGVQNAKDVEAKTSNLPQGGASGMVGMQSVMDKADAEHHRSHGSHETGLARSRHGLSNIDQLTNLPSKIPGIWQGPANAVRAAASIVPVQTAQAFDTIDDNIDKSVNVVGKALKSYKPKAEVDTGKGIAAGFGIR